MPDLSGQTFGQYQLVEPISSGGMATVYKAYQPALDRLVAIKVLPEYLLHQPGFLERFKIEAQAIARLDHPHILPVYDFGEAQRVPYLVMKYVPGGTLRDQIRQGPLDPHEAARLIRQIAEALDHAHQQGIIHRDVKPSNILLQDGQWVQLMDFGLAKMIESDSHITDSGVGVGTPDYMSPEQAQGQPVDARSDIYSLGVIVYQMLTGQLPFKADTPLAVLLKHLNEPPPSPREYNPHLSAATEHVILKALAKSPDQRYARAVDLANAIEQSLESGATLPLLSPATSNVGVPRWLIGLGALALVAVAAVVVALVTRPATGPDRSSAQLGATLFEDFGGSTVDEAHWYYKGSFTATLNSPAISIKSGRLIYDIANSDNEFFDGGARTDFDREVTLVAARVTLQDATGFSDIGLEVNGLDGAPDSWAYLAMNPSDGTVSAYVGHDSVGTEQTYTLVPGSGMPATHELAMGWDGTQITFYVDGLARKSLPTKERDHWLWLLFDVEPNGRVNGSFDDVRVTYAEGQ
jgi:serine/threonine protein kinase